ncbi:MAG: transposase, partial [Planctomycetes bacterium]|nr:transposase [Planctomycetota bacterium]
MLFAKRLVEEVLVPLNHRHVVLTIPKALRGLFERERELLGLLSRAGYDAVREAFAAAAPEVDGIPGVVSSLQTFGSFFRWNSHLHLVVADGLFTPAGGFQPVEWFDEARLEELFRRRVLAALHGAERLSEVTRERLL